jgi:acetyl-CoA synthetase
MRQGKVDIAWFADGVTNICYNCLDRNVQAGRGNQIAFFWEGNDPADHTTITYKALLDRVCKFANALKDKGVKAGDPVAIYQPMILDLVVAMLATARIGAVHSIIFGGFSAHALADRILDSSCRVLITAGKIWPGAGFQWRRLP